MTLKELIEQLNKEQKDADTYLRSHANYKDPASLEDFKTQYIKQNSAAEKLRELNRLIFLGISKKTSPDETFLKFDQALRDTVKLNERGNEEAAAKERQQDLTYYYFAKLVGANSSRPNIIYDTLKGEVDKDIEGFVLKEFENFKTIDTKEIEYEKTHEDKINELANTYKDDKKVLENLNFVNENVLVDIKEKYQSYYTDLSEKTGQMASYNTVKESVEVLNNDPTFGKVINLSAHGTFIANKNEISKNSNEIRSELDEKKIVFSKESKENIKNALEFLDSMKDMDGNPLLDLKTYAPEEGASKVYALKGIFKTKEKIDECITSGSKEDIEKLGTLTEYYKKATADVDKLIEITSKIDMHTIPGNVSVSRNEAMPAKYVKDYMNVSKINGLWHTLASIKKSGLTIDDYLNNPVDIFKKGIEDFKEFKAYNKTANEIGDLDLINSYVTKKSDSRLNMLTLQIVKDTDYKRFFETAALLDNTNAKSNNITSVLNSEILTSMISPAYIDLDNNLFKDNVEETIRNILVCEDKFKDYAKLSESTTLPSDPITGKAIDKFSYEDYITTHDFDYTKLNEKFDSYLNKADTRKYEGIQEHIEDAIIQISNDIVSARDIENEKAFEDILEKADLTTADYCRMKKGDMSINDYARENLSRFDENSSPEMLKSSLVALKGLNEAYNERSFLRKYFTFSGHRERRAIKDIKNSLQDKGISKDNLDDILSGETKMADVVQTYQEEHTVSNNVMSQKDLTDKLNKDVNSNEITNEKNKQLLSEKVVNKQDPNINAPNIKSLE